MISKKYISRLIMIATAMAFIGLTTLSVYGQAGAIFKTIQVLKNYKTLTVVITGAAASLISAKAAEEIQEKTVEQVKYTKIKEFKGYENKACIFSIRYAFDTSKGDVYWSDWFSKPDVFVVVIIEGDGPFLIPNIWNNYKGGEILASVMTSNPNPNSKIGVYLFDDDSFSNKIWNRILQHKISWGLNIDAEAMYSAELQQKGLKAEAMSGVKANFTAKGDLQILNSDIEIDGADLLASAIIPSSTNATWSKIGQVQDAHGNVVGQFELSKCAEIPIRSPNIFMLVLISGLAIVAVVLFVMHAFSRSKPISNPA